MRSFILYTLSAVLICLYTPASLGATESRTSLTLDRKNVWSFWTGISFDSPAGSHLGSIPDREFFIFGLQYKRILKTFGQQAIAYTFDAVPIAAVTKTPKVKWMNLPASTDSPFPDSRSLVVTDRDPAFGIGLVPVGIQLYVFQNAKLNLFAAASMGFLVFTRDVPTPNSRKFNFTFDYGGGVEIPIQTSWNLTLGYKFHHLSNAYTGRFNPGLDANLFYIGLVLR